MTTRQIILGNLVSACALILLVCVNVWAAETARELAGPLTHPAPREAAAPHLAFVDLPR
jgi:hypothetical protein